MSLQAVGAVAGPLLLGLPRRSFWVWLVLRQWQGIEDHCGYELPFAPSALLQRCRAALPASLSARMASASMLWGGSGFHDAHHAKFNGNYASVFPAIDWAFGTLLPAN